MPNRRYAAFSEPTGLSTRVMIGQWPRAMMLLTLIGQIDGDDGDDDGCDDDAL